MKREDPPATAPAAGRRRNKFSQIAAELVEKMGERGDWYNITEDINLAGGEGKSPAYYAELARSITAGNRAGFRPRGHFEGRAEGTQIWARAVPESQRRVVKAATDDDPAADPSTEDDTTDDPADATSAGAPDQEYAGAF